MAVTAAVAHGQSHTWIAAFVSQCFGPNSTLCLPFRACPALVTVQEEIVEPKPWDSVC